MIRDQVTTRKPLDLQLPQRRHVPPLADGVLSDPNRSGQSGLRPKICDYLVFCHVASIAYPSVAVNPRRTVKNLLTRTHDEGIVAPMVARRGQQRQQPETLMNAQKEQAIRLMPTTALRKLIDDCCVLQSSCTFGTANWLRMSQILAIAYDEMNRRFPKVAA